MSASYEGPAVLEIMGHQRLIGRVSKGEVGGVPLMRIDVVQHDGTEEARYYGAGAIYCVTPVPEDELQKEIDRRRAEAQLAEAIREINEAWLASPEGTDPAIFEWCEHLFGSLIDRDATAGERQLAASSVVCLILTDGYKLRWTEPWVVGGARGRWVPL